MNELQIFNSPEFGQVRVSASSGEAMFCLTDICKILDLTTPSKVKERLNEKGVNIIPTLTPGGTQQLTFINEPNLYKVIFQSRKPEAEKFTDWVTSKVLPSIRKHGAYVSSTSTINNTLVFINPILDESGITPQQKFRIVKGILEKSGIFIPDITIERKKETTAISKFDYSTKIAERFLNEGCIKDEQSIVTVADLFQDFNDWCRQNNVTAISKTALGRRLHNLGIGRHRGKHRYWVGIKTGD